ncbi:MAG: hypothetical protein ACOYMG_27795 [Candidatus Methylumidiphilus sp.]
MVKFSAKDNYLREFSAISEQKISRLQTQGEHAWKPEFRPSQLWLWENFCFLVDAAVMRG